MTEKPLKVIEHLSIDDKWGIAYDSSFNDSPLYFTRYGKPMDHLTLDNVHVAMFYALLGDNDG